MSDNSTMVQVIIEMPERDYKKIIGYPKNELEIAVKNGTVISNKEYSVKKQEHWRERDYSRRYE